MVERPADGDWLEQGCLPSGSELADYLAERYAFPADEPRDLIRVSQWVDLQAGDAALFEDLHGVFARRYKPNKLHCLVAALPEILRSQGQPVAGQLVITTNYDDVLERAFRAARERVDVVWYAAEPDAPGSFVHLRPDGKRVPIENPEEYRDFALEERSVILKLHGAVDRRNAEADSFVITEDHYIDYLALENIYDLIPAYLMRRMKKSNTLFLGYGMRDWNLRVILRHIWSGRKWPYASWAIQREPGDFDRRFWARHEVDIIEARLEDWVDTMQDGLQ
jgi:SIR2-like domain